MVSKQVHVNEILSIDYRSAALFRIFLGIYVVIDAVNRITLTPVFYSDSGLFPSSVVPLESFEYAIHFHGLFLSGSYWFAVLFFSITAVTGLCLLAGFKTKSVTILCWFLLCTTVVRDGLTVDSGDILLIQLLFWGMFLPLGQTYSLDSRFFSIKSRPENSYHFSVATVGLYIQFALIYITTGMFKGQYYSWLEGTHLYITFSRFEYMTPLAFLIYPYYDLLTFLTKFTLILELFGPLLFFIPFYFFFFRMMGIFLFLGLHISILLLMNVGIFPIASIAGIIVFIPSGFWDTITNVDKEQSNNELRNRFLRNSTFSIYSSRYVEHLKTIKKAIVNIFLVLVIIYITVWNFSELPGRFSLSDSLKKPGYFLKLDQRWAMFSSTVHYAEYYSVQALFNDGTTIDLLADLKKELNTSDKFHHVVFINFRWRKFLSERIHSQKYLFLRPRLIDYLVKAYEESEGDDKNIVRVDFIAHRHYIGQRYDHTEIEEVLLYSKQY
jgi:hypothetical protein